MPLAPGGYPELREAFDTLQPVPPYHLKINILSLVYQQAVVVSQWWFKMILIKIGLSLEVGYLILNCLKN